MCSAARRATFVLPSITVVRVPCCSDRTDTSPYASSGTTAAVASMTTKRVVILFTRSSAGILESPGPKRLKWVLAGTRLHDETPAHRAGSLVPSQVHRRRIFQHHALELARGRACRRLVRRK